MDRLIRSLFTGIAVLAVLSNGFFSLVEAGPPDVIWDRTYGDGEVFSVDETFDGGFIATGYWWDSLRILLLRTDANGDSLWTRTLMTGQGLSVQETSDHGYVIAGWYRSMSGGQRSILIRTNPDGDTLWTRSLGGGVAHGVLELPNGEFTVTGGSIGVFIWGTDASGNTLWLKSYGTVGDIGNSIDLTSDGGFIIGGQTRGGCICSDDGLILRTDANGDTLWTRRLNGPANNGDRVFSIKETTDLGFVFTGMVDAGGPWVGRMNSNGDTLWTKRYFGGPGQDIEELSQGGYVVVGSDALQLRVRRLDTAGDTLWTLDLGGEELPPYGDFDWGYSTCQTADGGFIIGGMRDCVVDEGGGCEVPHIWLVRLGPEPTSSTPGMQPETVSLRLAASPNPFSASTSLYFELPHSGSYLLVIYDPGGRRVAALVDEVVAAGPNRIVWDGRDGAGRRVTPGVYWARLSGSGETRVSKLVVSP